MDEGIREIEVAGHGATLVEPTTLILTLLMCVLVLALPRRYAIVPVIIVASVIPSAQRVVLVGMDFNMIRLLALVGAIRVLVRGEAGFLKKPTDIDRLFVAWAVAGVLIFAIGRGSFGALNTKMGMLLDISGGYLLFRSVLRGPADFITALSTFAVVAPIVGLMMSYELQSGLNPFHFFGGNEFVYYSSHTDRYRAVGPFSHPIMAGCYQALMSVCMIGLGLVDKKRIPLALFGLFGITMGVFAANTSGALLAYLVGMGAWSLWFVRKRIHWVWQAGLVLGVIVHFSMSKPIWHMFVRMASITGGSGYHRYNLIDACVRNFDQWVFFGTTRAAYWGYGLQDITNQWVLEAVNGGLLTLVLFNALLVVMFRDIGRALKKTREPGLWKRKSAKQLELLGWTMGCLITANCICFLSVSYFGQLNAFWYLSVALAAGYSSHVLEAKVAPAKSKPKPKHAQPEAALSKPQARPAGLAQLLS